MEHRGENETEGKYTLEDMRETRKTEKEMVSKEGRRNERKYTILTLELARMSSSSLPLSLTPRIATFVGSSFEESTLLLFEHFTTPCTISPLSLHPT